MAAAAAPIPPVPGPVHNIAQRQVLMIQGVFANKDEIKRVQNAAQEESKEAKLQKALMMLCGRNKQNDKAYLSIEFDPSQVQAADTLDMSGYQLHLTTISKSSTTTETSVYKPITLPAHTILTAQTPIRLTDDEILTWSFAQPTTENSRLELQLVEASEHKNVVARAYFPGYHIPSTPHIPHVKQSSSIWQMQSDVIWGLALCLAMILYWPLSHSRFSTTPCAMTQSLTVTNEINTIQGFVPYHTVLQSASGQFFSVLTRDQLQTWSTHPRQVLETQDYLNFFANHTSTRDAKFILISSLKLPVENMVLGFDGKGKFIGRPQHAVQETWHFKDCGRPCSALRLDHSGELVLLDEQRRIIADRNKNKHLRVI